MPRGSCDIALTSLLTTILFLTECQCNIPGVIGSIGECDGKTGQCICKPAVTSRDCSECIDGSYSLQESNLFGCSGKLLDIFNLLYI